MRTSDSIKLHALLALLAVLATITAIGASHPAVAEANYPNRPVRLVVPFAAGGVADSTARIVACRCSRSCRSIR
jgi:tripartite-type tricarboxylate transporter receptor subunit TctC